MFKKQSLLILFFSFCLIACGGSGSQPPENPENNGGSNDGSGSGGDDDGDASEDTQAAYINRFSEYVDQHYSGQTEPVGAQLQNVQAFAPWVFQYDVAPGLGRSLFNRVRNRLGNELANQSANYNILCESGGHIHVTGQTDETGQGAVELSLNNCAERLSSRDYTLNGKAIIPIDPAAKEDSFVFNELAITGTELSFVVSGYVLWEFTNTNDVNVTTRTNKLLYISNEEEIQYVDDTVLVSTYDHALYPAPEHDVTTFNGSLFLSSYGQLTLASTSYSEPSTAFYTFNGANNTMAQLTFAYYWIVKYSEAQDSNGEQSVSAYFSNLEEFYSKNAEEVSLIDSDSLSLPPVVRRPTLASGVSLLTSNDLTVQTEYSDDDTPEETLEQTYHWYINGERVSSVKSNVLPAGTAVKNDEVTVSLQVADGQSQIIGAAATFIIEDAPQELHTTGMPSTIRTGETLSLTASVEDPDIGDETSPPILISGPEGMTMNELGEIEWVASDMLLNSVEVHIAVGIEGVEDSTQEFSISVDGNNVSSPRAYTGVLSAKRGQSLVVADFLTDDGLEILVADVASNISIVTDQNGHYLQQWVYPYKMPELGNLKQVFAYDMDRQGKSEILAVFDYGIGIIESLSQKMSILHYNPETYHRAAAIKYASAPGNDELVILSSATSSAQEHVHVYNIGESLTETQAIPLSENAENLELANVDTDNALEIITNDGFVIDTETWVTEWHYTEGFGAFALAVGDFNGDGVNEIAVGESDRSIHTNTLKIFSAVDKSVIPSNFSDSICELLAMNLYPDEKDEILIGSCNNRIDSAQLNDGSIEFIETIAYEFVSGLGHGDANNDGVTEILSGSLANHGIRVTSYEKDAKTFEHTNSPIGIATYHYYPAGWDNNGSAVYFLPELNTEYEGEQHIVSISPIGDWSHLGLEGIPRPGFGATDYDAIASDVDNNGNTEVFMVSSYSDIGVSTHNVKAVDLQTGQLMWELDRDGSTPQPLLTLQDINADGVQDLIFQSDESITVYSALSQEELASFHENTRPLDTVVLNTSTNNYSDFVTTDGSFIFLWQHDGTGYKNTATTPSTCTQIELGNMDDDLESEIVCTDVYQSAGSYNYFSVYDISETGFTQLTQFTLEQMSIEDFTLDRRSPQNQDLLVGACKNDFLLGNVCRIYKVDGTTGHKIWTSNPVIGDFASKSFLFDISEQGHRFMFSTVQAMYVVQ